VSEAAALADIFYNSLGHHVEDDVSGDLQKLSEGLCLPLQPMYDLVRPRLDQDGWAILLDPDECPAYALPWLAQVVGVRLTPGMSEEQQRNEIRQPTGWKRSWIESIRIGTRATLKPVAEEELLVIIHPRTPEPGRHYIRTLLAQTPEPDRTEWLLEHKLTPAWERVDYAAIETTTFDDIADSWKAFAALVAAKPSFKKVAETLPAELPE
jgi:hypothetical protein